MTLFDGEVALVTGASSGIGRATATAFAASGARVALADLQTDPGEELAAALRADGADAHFFAADMAEADDVKAMVAGVIERWGRLDAAFNNAGVEGETAPTAECTVANWDRVLAINLTGVFHCMRHEIPAMLEGGGGAIVNCSSVAGSVGFAGIPAYVASKHGLIGLSRTAALEYAQQNIRVNTVSPGVIRTPMVERFTQGDPEALAALEAMEPVGHIGEPQDVANMVVWLCSDRASFVTGADFAVDGGFLAK